MSKKRKKLRTEQSSSAKTPNEPLVFLSHSSTTQDKVEQLQKYLRANGFRTWYSKEDIRIGERFNRVIPPAIKSSDAVVILLCKAADDSENVEAEIHLAKKNKKPVFSLRVENIEPERLEYFLDLVQYLDWFDTEDLKPLQQLVERIREELNKATIDSAPDLEEQSESSSPASKTNDEDSQTDDATAQVTQKSTWLTKLFLVTLALAALIAGGVYLHNNNASITPTTQPYDGQKWDVFGLASSGTPERIRQAIDAGANFNILGEDGDTPLHKAAASNPNPESIRLLISLGLDVNALGKGNYTVLMRAVENPNAEIVRVLLENNADVNLHRYDDTALSLAASSYDNPETVKLLLEAHSELDRESLLNGEIRFTRAPFLKHNPPFYLWRGNIDYPKFRVTLLGAAVMAGNPNIVKYLVDLGCNVEAPNYDGITTLMLAAGLSESDEVVRIISRAVKDINGHDRFGQTALEEAVSCGSVEMVKILIDAGADVNAKDDDGETILMYACNRTYWTDEKQLAEIIMLLLNAGADINALGGSYVDGGRRAIDHARENKYLKDNPVILKLLTPDTEAKSADISVSLNAASLDKAGVFRLAAEGTPEQIQAAINAGAEFDIMSDDKETPFMKSVLRNQNKESVRLLIHQLNKMTKQRQLDAAMKMAAMEVSNLEIIKLLAEEGADLQSGSDSDDKPLFWAAMYNPNPDVTRFFLEAESGAMQQVFLNGPLAAELLDLASTANASNPEVAEYLLNAGIDVNAQNEDGMTALMYSACFGYSSEMLQLLLDHGANPNIQNNKGKTALMYAAGRSVWPMVETLIGGGANVYLTDNDGMTALIYAAQTFANPAAKRKIIELLVNASADIYFYDNEGKTAFDYAMNNYLISDDLNVLKMLKPSYSSKAGSATDSEILIDKTLIFDLASRGTPAQIKRAIYLGFDFNVSDDKGATPLHYAARHNKHPEVIRLLVGWGIEAYEQDEQGDDPLMYAVAGDNNLEVVKTLVELGSDSFQAIFRVPFRSLEVFKFLFNSMDSDKRELLLKGYLRNRHGMSLLQCAFYNTDIVKFLIESGADVNQKDEDGDTVLMRGSMFGNVYAKKALLDAGADVNAKNFYGQTALMRSASDGYEGYMAEVELFINYKADVNAQDNNGKTALMYAAEWYNNDLKYLSGEDISEIEKNNQPRFYARSIRMLLNAGADINIQTKAGKRVIDLMDKKLLLKFNPLLLLMLTPESQRQDEVFDFADVCTYNDLYGAINLGLDFNVKDKNNATPLHHAAAKNADAAVISELVSLGLDVNARDSEGTTPLIEAARRNSQEIVEALLNAGADADISDNAGRYPVDFVSGDVLMNMLKR